MPAIGTEYQDPRVWLILKIRLDEGRLTTWVEMQGIEDAAKRSQLLEALFNEVQSCGLKAQPSRKRIGGRYTRISVREAILEWSEGDQPDAEAVRTAVKKSLDELYPKLDKLASALKPLCKQLG